MDSTFAWRLPFTILACLSMVYAAGSILWLVPSPRWLTLRGRQSEASAAWDVLGVGHAEREKAEEIEQAATVAEARNPSPTEKHSFLDVFARDVWSRTFMAIFLLGMQQLCGIDGVLYVSHVQFQKSTLFKQHSHRTSLTPQSMHLYSSRKLASPPQKPPFSLLASRQLSYSALLFPLSSFPINGAVEPVLFTVGLG